jgi:hypothetical protein
VSVAKRAQLADEIAQLLLQVQRLRDEVNGDCFGDIEEDVKDELYSAIASLENAIGHLT